MLVEFLEQFFFAGQMRIDDQGERVPVVSLHQRDQRPRLFAIGRRQLEETKSGKLLRTSASSVCPEIVERTYRWMERMEVVKGQHRIVEQGEEFQEE